MSLKSAIKHISIRTRLTLFYALGVFILLGLSALFLYWVTIQILHKADYEFLADEVDTIHYILENRSLDLAALEEAVMTAPLQDSNSIYRYYIRIFDHEQKLMMETPSMDQILPAEKIYHSNAEVLEKKRYFWYSKEGQDFLLIQAPVKVGHQDKTLYVQVALNISHQHNVISNHKKVLGFLVVAILFSLFIGYLFAYRGLYSLYSLTESVKRITASSLDQRIDVKSLPKELTGLSHAFNQMLDRVEASFLRLKQFSADLAHELRTPVTNLIGQTEITLSYPQTVEQYKQVLESNLEELQRISSLIQNMLFLARAENPQYALKKENLNVTQEIALVCEFYQAISDEKNIRVDIEGEANLSANKDMFRRVINNILANALRATAEGGTLTFIISQGNTIEIKLIDHGIGIAKEHLGKLFDRFYRVDSARSVGDGGSGLGLPIVKSIVELHHGTIDIVSEPGQGTTVILRFPKE